MFNYSFTRTKIIQDNLPLFLQRQWRVDWIKALMKPLKVIYTEFLILKTEYIYKVRFNGQRCYLESILNDNFAPGTTNIYITDGTPNQVYIYNNIEAMPPVYLYNTWDPNYNYSVKEYAYLNGVVYECIAGNIGQNPSSSASWSATPLQPTFIYNQSEINSAPGFIVWVPNTLVYDVNKMKALIDYYRLAGKSYIIQTY